LTAFVRKLLSTLPQPAYEQPLAVHRFGRGRTITWVTDPGLIERILLHEHDPFPKTPIDKRILVPTLSQGILTAVGTDWH
jgi:hypothetical protein